MPLKDRKFFFHMKILTYTYLKKYLFQLHVMNQTFAVVVEFKGIKNVKDVAFKKVGSMMVMKIAVMVQMKGPQV